jgi:hypothetical protein
MSIKSIVGGVILLSNGGRSISRGVGIFVFIGLQIFVVQVRFSHSPLQVSHVAQVQVVVFIQSLHSLSSLYSIVLPFQKREKGFSISENSKSVSQLGVSFPLLSTRRFIFTENSCK